MTQALTWLNDLMVWLGKWFPRAILVRATHQGVRFGLGGCVRALAPGLHVYWPMIHEVELVSTRQRTLATSSQVHDMEVVGLVITYQVDDPTRLLMSMVDPHANIDQRAQSALSLCHSRATGNEALSAAIKERLVAEFKDSGITVFDVGITQRSFCLPFKTLSDWTYTEDKKL